MHMFETKMALRGKLKVVIIHKMTWLDLTSVMELVD